MLNYNFCDFAKIVRAIIVVIISLPITVNAIDVEIDRGDFKGTYPGEVYPVYNGALTLDGTISSKGVVRNYATWSIAYGSFNDCVHAESVISDDDGTNYTCGDGREFDLESGYSHSWLDNPHSSLKVGGEGINITGGSGAISTWHWNVNSIYKVKLYSKSTFSSDSAERLIKYMGKPKLMANDNKKKLENTLDISSSGDLKATLYFFSAKPDNYKLKNCVVSVDTDYGSSRVRTDLLTSDVHYISDNGGAFVSFSLKDLRQLNSQNLEQIQKILVTPSCHFEKMEGTLGTLTGTDSLTYQLDIKNLKKVDVITVIKTIERPEIDNLFAISLKGLTAHHLKINGNVVKMLDEEAKADGFDSANQLTYYLASATPEGKPNQWKSVNELGGHITFGPNNRSFVITNISSDKLLRSNDDSAWIKVSARSHDGKIVESIPRVIQFRLTDNVEMAFQNPENSSFTQDKKQANICKPLSAAFPMRGDILFQLDVREEIDISKLIFDFNDIDSFKLLFQPPYSALITSQGGLVTKKIIIGQDKIHISSLDLKVGTLSRGKYFILIPIEFTPHDSSVFINATLWGSIARNNTSEKVKLDAHDITYSYSSSFCH